MNTEYEIIEGLKAGHEEAYKYIYERQYKILCIIAKEYVDDTFTAEMIVSDVIFALWKNRKEIDINLSLRSYLISPQPMPELSCPTEQKGRCPFAYWRPARKRTDPL